MHVEFRYSDKTHEHGKQITHINLEEQSSLDHSRPNLAFDNIDLYKRLLSKEDVVIRTGERIAQFSLEATVSMNINYVDEIDTDTPSLGMVKWIAEHIKSKVNKVQKEQYPTENVSKEKILEVLNLDKSQND